MSTTVEMYRTEGWQNAARRHHAYVLPVTTIQVPDNAAHNLLTYTEARHHDLRTMVQEVVQAAGLEQLRYCFEDITKTAYAD